MLCIQPSRGKAKSNTVAEIFSLSDAASMGIRSVLYIAKHKQEWLQAKQIAQDLAISYHHLNKVLQRLRKVQILLSIKGTKGGFKLARSPLRITLLDIYEAIEGSIMRDACPLYKEKTVDRCVLGSFIFSINKQAMEFFSMTTVYSCIYSMEKNSIDITEGTM